MASRYLDTARHAALKSRTIRADTWLSIVTVRAFQLDDLLMRLPIPQLCEEKGECARSAY
jgi:hypothetical protein